MAFASLFTLLDDITSVLDDVALMTKMAAKKTAGVVGDDLALNANQVTGVSADRELPIIWAVAKGSLVNKIILVPLALLLSFFLPAAITPLLMIGGAYLCFEGVEKLLHKFLRSDGHEEAGSPAETLDEKTKIKGAIRTDFILSAEIIIIALGVVERYDAVTQSLVMAAIGVGMTAFVYGLVGVIVKLDDLGMFLMKKDSGAAKTLGRGPGDRGVGARGGDHRAVFLEERPPATKLYRSSGFPNRRPVRESQIHRLRVRKPAWSLR